jgi:Protein of unknown function (DUF2934)
MSQTDRMIAGRPVQQPRRVRPVAPGQDGVASGRESRRLIEPLDESGGPILNDTAGQDSRQLEDAIRVRAYERYLQRQGSPGSAENDWLEAEREVRSTMWTTKDRPRQGGSLST